MGGKPTNRPCALWLCAGLLSQGVSPAIEAQPVEISVLQRQALAQGLDRQEGWLAMVHYRPQTLRDGFVSDADDPAFFLAADGKENPRAELLATLAAVNEETMGDKHPLCRFPARFHWLSQKLRLKLPAVTCPAYQEWKDTLNAQGVSLIFPTAYLNSPSSMFGHTFLRLDRPGQNEDNVLLAFAINYAADAVDSNELMYAYRGLFGGYAGRVSVLPYYEKVKEYTDWENRDIWEYRLNLSPAEVAQLVRHTWEVQPIRFDYFFIGENCSYRLLSLLDVARPGLALRLQFPWRTIPADSVRAIVAARLVDEASFRPSAATTLKAHVAQLTLEQQASARQLSEGGKSPEDVATGSTKDQAAILDVAYESARYQAQEQKLAREQAAELSYRLLRARSRIDVGSSLAGPKTPETRDDQGHKPMAVGLGAGYFDRQAFGELAFRSGYHGLTDPWPGYRLGAQIQFLDTRLRFYESQGLKLEQLTALSIKSLSSRDQFIHPLSWAIELGGHRKLLRDRRPLVGYLTGEAGLSYAWGDGLAFAMIGASLEAGGALDEAVSLGLGPHLGWLYHAWGGQGLMDLNADCFLVGRSWCGGRLSWQHTINFGDDVALQLKLSRELGQNRSADELGLSLQHYF